MGVLLLSYLGAEIICKSCRRPFLGSEPVGRACFYQWSDVDLDNETVHRKRGFMGSQGETKPENLSVNLCPLQHLNHRLYKNTTKCPK